jgi:hypothetical protein
LLCAGEVVDWALEEASVLSCAGVVVGWALEEASVLSCAGVVVGRALEEASVLSCAGGDVDGVSGDAPVRPLVWWPPSSAGCPALGDVLSPEAEALSS